MFAFIRIICGLCLKDTTVDGSLTGNHYCNHCGTLIAIVVNKQMTLQNESYISSVVQRVR